MEGVYLEKDYSLKIENLPWPEDYFKSDDKSYIVAFDDWSIEYKSAKKRLELDKASRYKKCADRVRRRRNNELKRLILYLYCKNMLFQLAFLYYQFDYELGYKPPHKSYFRILTVIFMRIWASIEH